MLRRKIKTSPENKTYLAKIASILIHVVFRNTREGLEPRMCLWSLFSEQNVHHICKRAYRRQHLDKGINSNQAW